MFMKVSKVKFYKRIVSSTSIDPIIYISVYRAVLNNYATGDKIYFTSS